MTYKYRDAAAAFLRAIGSNNVNRGKRKQHGLYARATSEKVYKK